MRDEELPPPGRDGKRWRGDKKLDPLGVMCPHCIARYKVLEMILNNYTLDEVAEEQQIAYNSVSTMLTRLRQAGYKIAQGSKRTKKGKVDEDRIRHLLNLGLPERQIARELKVTKGAIGYWKRKIRDEKVP